MQDHPLAAEANSSSNSTLANLASSTLGNSSLQNDITPLLEFAQSSTVASTLPTSNYFDHEYFLSLILFDLAINVPTMTISKILFDMAQHRLPLPPRPIFSINNRNSSTRMKPLNEMINNSFEDLLLDVTIPLDRIKATKIIQYYKKLDEHCRQYYLNEQNSLEIEKQVKLTEELLKMIY